MRNWKRPRYKNTPLTTMILFTVIGIIGFRSWRRRVGWRRRFHCAQVLSGMQAKRAQGSSATKQRIAIMLRQLRITMFHFKFLTADRVTFERNGPLDARGGPPQAKLISRRSRGGRSNGRLFRRSRRSRESWGVRSRPPPAKQAPPCYACLTKPT